MKTAVIIFCMIGLLAYSYLCLTGQANNAILLILPLILVAILCNEKE